MLPDRDGDAPALVANEAGVAVLIVEQNAKAALRRCGRGYGTRGVRQIQFAFVTASSTPRITPTYIRLTPMSRRPI